MNPHALPAADPVRCLLCVMRGSPLQLQGWGIELAIKNMEYKVLDDSRVQSSTSSSTSASASSTLWHRLHISDADTIASLSDFQAEYLVNVDDERIFRKDNKDYQLSDLALQTTQVVLHSDDPLAALYELTGNFPAYASALTKVQVSRAVLRGVERKEINPGANLISLHGQALSLQDLDVYSLLSLLQSHVHLIDFFAALHLSPASTRQLLSATMTAGSGVDPAEAMLAMYGGGTDPNTFLIAMDTSDPDVSSLLLWLNDIAQDKRYNQWPRSVHEFLQPAWGQQLKYVRQNVYTAVILADLTTRAGLELVQKCLFFVKGNAPIRLALLPFIPQEGGAARQVEWDESLVSQSEYATWMTATPADGGAAHDSLQAKLARLIHYVDAEHGREAVWDWIELLYQEGLDLLTEDIALDLLQQVASETEAKGQVAAVLADPAHAQYVTDLLAYASTRGLTATEAPSLILHGAVHRYLPEHSADFRSFLMELIFNEQRKAGLRVYAGVFTDRMDFAAYWNSRSKVYPKIAPHILRAPEQRTFLPSLLPAALPSDPAPKLAYFTASDADREFLVKGVSYWVVADWDSVAGLTLVRAALQHVDTEYKAYQTRVAFIHNPVAPATSTSAYTARLASAIAQSLTTSKSFTQLKRLAVIASNVLATNPSALLPALQHFVQSTPQLAKVVTALSSGPHTLNKGAGLNPAVPSSYLSEQLQAKGGESMVIANGYVVRLPANASLASLVSDFRVLDGFVHGALKAESIRSLVETFAFPGVDADDLTADWYSDIVMHATFALSTRAVKTPQRASAVHWPSVLDATEDEAVIVHTSPDAWMEMKVLLNPLSKEAQQLSGVLLALRRSFNLSMQIFLNPARNVAELPLKRFYHYAVDLQPHFDERGAFRPFPGAFFRHLQTRAVLTMTVDTPEPWLVMLKVAPYDLDNLKLDTAGGSEVLEVEYELEHLLISGQCFDYFTKPASPPAGLQLQLSSPSVPYAGDTVVMANLGYFQLQGQHTQRKHTHTQQAQYIPHLRMAPTCDNRAASHLQSFSVSDASQPRCVDAAVPRSACGHLPAAAQQPRRARSHQRQQHTAERGQPHRLLQATRSPAPPRAGERAAARGAARPSHRPVLLHLPHGHWSRFPGRLQHHPHLFAGVGAPVRALSEDHDAVGDPAHSVAGEVLVHPQLRVPSVCALCAAHGRALQLFGAVRHLQVAGVAAAAGREAAGHLGLQDPLPRRALAPAHPPRHLHRRRPGGARRREGAVGHGPAAAPLRLRALL